MAYRVDVSTLQASSVDIINTIRQNASEQYQSQVPAISKASEIPKVGEVLMGYPVLANQFLTELMNRVALVLVKSATFNNPYAELKKGYLDYGETVEEVFVELAKAREFSVEKAAARELRRTVPDVRTAFHCLNWSVQYPVTIQRNDLRKAFLSAEGVYGLVEKIVQSLYTANNYDEFLLFKYLLIKGVNKGIIKPLALEADTTNAAAISFRATSTLMTFLKTDFNARGVHTSTPRNDQFIFMDARYNAKYDVDELAVAFQMDKADFQGHLLFMDEWDTFDNERFSAIIENTDMIEEVTAAELAVMKNVRAIAVDREWFQFYDNSIIFDDTKVAAGNYWNYFLNVEKTVSWSPFSNAVAFLAPAGAPALPETITVEVAGKSISPEATVLTLTVEKENGTYGNSFNFVQTEALTATGIAVHPYGAIMIPAGQSATNIALEVVIDGVTYYAQANINADSNVGATVEFKQTTLASLTDLAGDGVTTVSAKTGKASK